MKVEQQTVLSVLQRLDVMGTGAALNGLEDEYKLEAAEITRLLSSGRAVRDAIAVTFDKCFWPGVTVEPERMNAFELLVGDLQEAVNS